MSALKKMYLNLAPTALLLTLGLAGSSFALADISAGAPPSSDPTVVLGEDPQISFNFDIGNDIGSVTLEANQVAGTDYYFASSGTLTLTSGSDAAAGTYSLYSGGPGFTVSPSGSYMYDNLVFPADDPQNGPHSSSDPNVATGTALDTYGLLFTGHGIEINIWGNTAGNYTFGSTSNINGSTSGTPAAPSITHLTVTAAEPSGILLLATMLLGVGFSCRRLFSRG